MAGRDTPLGLFSEEAPATASEVSPPSPDASSSASASSVAALLAQSQPGARAPRLIRIAVLLAVAAAVGVAAVWGIQSRAPLVSAVRDRLVNDPLFPTRGQVQQPASQESAGPIEPAVRKEPVVRQPSPRRRARKVTEERPAAAVGNGAAEIEVDELVSPLTTAVDRSPVAPSEAVVVADAAPATAGPGVEPRASSRAADATPARIYSERDPEVTPPEPRRPQKLTALHVGGRPDDVVTIELVINARGRLDSARATTPPRSVGESLLLATGLHAVKSWEFRPALKDGFPVSYRTLMSLGAY